MKKSFLIFLAIFINVILLLGLQGKVEAGPPWQPFSCSVTASQVDGNKIRAVVNISGDKSDYNRLGFLLTHGSTTDEPDVAHTIDGGTSYPYSYTFSTTIGSATSITYTIKASFYTQSGTTPQRDAFICTTDLNSVDPTIYNTNFQGRVHKFGPLWPVSGGLYNSCPNNRFTYGSNCGVNDCQNGSYTIDWKQTVNGVTRSGSVTPNDCNGGQPNFVIRASDNGPKGSASGLPMDMTITMNDTSVKLDQWDMMTLGDTYDPFDLGNCREVGEGLYCSWKRSVQGITWGGQTRLRNFPSGSPNYTKTLTVKLYDDGQDKYTWNSLGIATTPCGNNTLEPSEDETCDDGNNDSGDGCSNVCQTELINNAACVSIALPATIYAGQPYLASVTMKNTGGNPWTAAKNYKLGSQNPQDNIIWRANRVDYTNTVSYPVLAGQTVTYTFPVTAPSTPTANQSFNWRMVQEGVGWFGATCGVTRPILANQSVCGRITYQNTGAGASGAQIMLTKPIGTTSVVNTDYLGYYSYPAGLVRTDDWYTLYVITNTPIPGTSAKAAPPAGVSVAKGTNSIGWTWINYPPTETRDTKTSDAQFASQKFGTSDCATSGTGRSPSQYNNACRCNFQLSTTVNETITPTAPAPTIPRPTGRGGKPTEPPITTRPPIIPPTIPPVPLPTATITIPGCIYPNDSGSQINISWTNDKYPVTWANIVPSTGGQYHNDQFAKIAYNNVSINGTGFNGFNGTSGLLTFNPAPTSYQVDLFDGSRHSYKTFTIPACIDGGWDDPCSTATCGTRQTRYCNSPPTGLSPSLGCLRQNGTRTSPDDISEIITCPACSCTPVNGRWTAPSPCNAVCGGGQQLRYCTQPAPACGGSECLRNSGTRTTPEDRTEVLEGCAPTPCSNWLKTQGGDVHSNLQQ